MSVNEKMTELASAIRAKAGKTGKLSIDGMTAAVNAIATGSQMVKVTEYIPYRAELTAPEEIVVSGIMTDEGVGSSWNGTYTVTPETKFKTGFERVYKRVYSEDTVYYIARYDASAEEYPEFSSHWFIGETPTSYGYSAKLAFEGDNIPSGTNTWINYNDGSFPITTELRMVTYPEQPETVNAVAVTRNKDGEWVTGDPVSIDTTNGPLTVGGIYNVDGGGIVGNTITSVSPDISDENLLRHFTTVNGGHFVDRVYGVELLPTQKDGVSFKDQGYFGGVAPRLVGNGCWLQRQAMIVLPDTVTINFFVKPVVSNRSQYLFGMTHDDYSNTGIKFALASSGQVGVSVNYYNLITTSKALRIGEWNAIACRLTFTRQVNSGQMCVTNVSGDICVNGVYEELKSVKPNTDYTRMLHSYCIGAGCFFDGPSDSNLIGLIDDIRIWGRILSNEEITSLHSGVQKALWDAVTPEYVQQQPVLQADLVDSLDTTTGQVWALSGSGLPLESLLRDGGLWNYGISADTGNATSVLVSYSGNFPGLYTSANFTIIVDVFIESSAQNTASYAYENRVVDDGTDQYGLFFVNNAGSDDYHMLYKEGNYNKIHGSITIPRNTWTTLAVVCDNSNVSLYCAGIINGTGTAQYPNPFSGDRDGVRTPSTSPSVPCIYAIRKLKIYNRALSAFEIQVESGSGESAG